MLKKFKDMFIGKALDPTAVDVFHKMSLIAFLAWVGLGADGLSSSAYGPEEAFRALGGNHHLALYLALATALTVFIISASYNQIIELFPGGGGGYVVASKMLGPGPGVVAGAALLIDYVLTITVSIASGVDAVFSFLPPDWQAWKLASEFIFIFLLIWLNMRGMKESIQVLIPIFLVFILTHALLIGWGVFSHGTELPGLLHGAVGETRQMVAQDGLWRLVVVLFPA